MPLKCLLHFYEIMRRWLLKSNLKSKYSFEINIVINWTQECQESINCAKDLKIASFLTCFRVHSSEVSFRGIAFCCIRHRKLLCDGRKFVRPFAVEFLWIQYVNYGKGNLMRGRHSHSTFLRVQHPFPRRYKKAKKEEKKTEELARVITRVPRNDPCFTSCLQASLGRMSGDDPTEFGLHGSCLSVEWPERPL